MVSCGYLSGFFIASSKRRLVEHIEVHVEAAMVEIHVEGFDGGVDEFLVRQMRLLRRDRNGVADAVQRIVVGQFRHRQTRREPAVTVAAVHGIGAGREWLTLAAAVRRVAGCLP